MKLNHSSLVEEILELISSLESGVFTKRIQSVPTTTNSVDVDLLLPVIKRLNSFAYTLELQNESNLIYKEKMKHIQRLAQVGDWERDLTSCELIWSDEMYRLIDVPVGDPKCTLEYFISRVHPEDQELVRTAAINALKFNRPYSLEFRIVNEDGTCRYLHTIVELKFDNLGNPIKLSGTSQNITERKEYENKLICANSELQTSHDNLEAFSYTVSHDLRAPLRTITSFTQIVLDNKEEKLSFTTQDSLCRVKNAAHKMQLVIDGLLELARISHASINRVKVNLSQIVQDIVTELQQQNPERVVECVIEKNIIIEADLLLITIAMNNVLSNAFKFSSLTEKAVVEFGVLKINNDEVGKLTYFVRDNGAGFDMRHIKKLFGPFDRLHSNKEFPGMGIGLATVKKIISRHNGKIWAEAERNKGAIFYIQL